ncbi:hypothetical protein PENSUB_8068 [Penicillium subrubescens]|uniref:Uncharacterized protein n=1 Tax=Penicillium subrubescens TaxID=1316194 RepID=A0A1Q5TI00_9EURO|nr:hypothetical protein PENSUB_8068 [Penicillium subrubescens]
MEAARGFVERFWIVDTNAHSGVTAHKDQEHRESKNRWLDFAYGGARASDRARTSPPKETDLMDTVEDEMEASKVLTLNPKTKKGPEPQEKTVSKHGPPETVLTRHLLD